MTRSIIEVADVSKSFASKRVATSALEDVSLSIEAGRFVSLLGPSGCGKSTLLKIVAGLESANSGTVRVNGAAVSAPPRDLVYVFQQYTKSIFPWRTVRGNVRFGLVGQRRVSRSERRRRTEQYIERVGLRGFERHWPRQLSGGMQQRVAIARAMVGEPAILLMDEPFSSVDALTRGALQDLLLDVWQRSNLTVVFVTHDVEEAVYLSQEVVVMCPSPGRVVERVEIDLPYPRDQITTKEDSRFLRHRHEMLELILSLKPPDSPGRRDDAEDTGARLLPLDRTGRHGLAGDADDTGLAAGDGGRS